MQENPTYLKEQIITYIGNKRAFLSALDNIFIDIKRKLGKDKMVTADLFSGSGVVARLLKQHSSDLIVNDLELYSFILNQAFLSVPNDEEKALIKLWVDKINKEDSLKAGFISRLYAPEKTQDIKNGERVFFTRENALFIDTARNLIQQAPMSIQKYLLAQLIVECSIKNNTAGVFKGFYKDKSTGIGKFGGTAANALSRIMSPITLKEPVYSNFITNNYFYQEDTNLLVKKLELDIDVTYLDPPYNQHPYGSNYFMLNVIAENKEPINISDVAGIPKDWNRSQYNQKQKALEQLTDLCVNLNSAYIVISYNSEGFIRYEEMTEMLESLGNLEVLEYKYNTYRASRNLHNRDLHVQEYIFILEKDKK